MRSLNTYNYREELYMKPISYQVTISDYDKVIKIEDDGDLIAELSFATDGNVLYLNGKDGLEVAQVELPISLAEIVKQQYNEETKEIELSILKTNGETVVFGLDVAELVNVYTGGDGIDITDNVISIKIKDGNGPLHVDQNGLDIDMDSLATADDVKAINEEIANLKDSDASLNERIDSIIDVTIGDSFSTIEEAISGLSESIDTINETLESEAQSREAKDAELKASIDEEVANRLQQNTETLAAIESLRQELEAADLDLQEQIGDVKGELEGSISDEISKLKDEIGNVAEELEGSISTEISKLKDEIGDVAETLEGSITEEIAKLKEEMGNATEELEGSVTEELAKINAELDELRGGIDGSVSEAISEIRELVTNEEAARIEAVETLTNALAEESAKSDKIASDLAEETTAREEGDAFLQSQLGNGFIPVSTMSLRSNSVSVTVTDKVAEIEAAIAQEIIDRETGDNQYLNLVSTEKAERKAADDALAVSIEESTSELAESIKLVQDANNNLKYTLFVNNVEKGVINIPSDKMLEKVEYNEETNQLTFYWNTEIPQTPTVIDMTDLVDEYFAGNGILLENHTFSLNVATSKYIALNENGSAEFVGELKKVDGTPWMYELVGSNGKNNGKVIDFTADYESMKTEIQDTYAPKTYVDAQDESVKSSLIGVDGDGETADTLYGVRAAIVKASEVSDAKLAEEVNRATESENALNKRIDSLKGGSKEYIDSEIEKVNSTIVANEDANSAKHSELADAIRVNSDNIEKISNESGTGVVDKLDKQFHEVTSGIDENNFEGLIKSLMDKISTLEATIKILIGDADVEGSVAYSVSTALTAANEYTDVKSVAALENAVNYANETFQVKGDYITEIDGQYITEDELKAYNYVNGSDLTTTLTEYVTKEVADKTYQPVGDYLTSIDGEYITETELAAMGYATKSYVDERDSKLLSKEMADLLYATIDTGDKYVKTSELNSKGYATEAYVTSQTSDKLTKVEAAQTYQLKGNYIETIPSEYVTESELNLYNFAKQTDLNREVSNIQNYVDTKTQDMLTKTEALGTYQLKGDYLTESTLLGYGYATKADVANATADLVKSSELSKYQPVGNYVTVSELEGKKYVDETTLTSKNYATMGYVENAVTDMETKTNAAKVYATKEELNKHVSSAFTAANIIAGDNIQLSRIGDNVSVAVKLSDNYNVNDIYGQNLPKAGNNLDLVSEKLSEAIKKLYDTTDGEMF